VAGTIENFLSPLSENLDAGQARELQTIRPASHTTALGELFIAEVWGRVQAKVYEVGSGDRGVRRYSALELSKQSCNVKYFWTLRSVLTGIVGIGRLALCRRAFEV
jgi:hypothetical protein